MNYFRLDGNIAILNSYKKFHSAVIVILKENLWSHRYLLRTLGK